MSEDTNKSRIQAFYSQFNPARSGLQILSDLGVLQDPQLIRQTSPLD